LGQIYQQSRKYYSLATKPEKLSVLHQKFHIILLEDTQIGGMAEYSRTLYLLLLAERQTRQ